MDGNYNEAPTLPASYSRLSLSSSQGSSVSCISPTEDRTLSLRTSIASEGLPDNNGRTNLQGGYGEGSRPLESGLREDRKRDASRADGEKRSAMRQNPHVGQVNFKDMMKQDTDPVQGLNCQKNNAVCEGYQAAEQWRQTRMSKGENGRRSIDLPPLINGVENETDRLLLSHFNHQLVHILSLFTGDRNPFIEILMPMALQDTGLMHSLLCLSGCHFAERTRSPTIDVSEITQRQQYHFDAAVSYLRQRDLAIAHTCAEHNETDDISVAQMMLLCLKTAVNGETDGEYAIHMDAARHLVWCAKAHASNSAFQSFVNEFFVYHDVSNALTSLRHRSSLLLDPDTDFPPFIQPEAGSYLGILSSIFLYLRKITSLRDRIRERRANGLVPFVDFQILAEGEEINQGLKEWDIYEQPGTPRFLASHLYRQCTWIYLHRTICLRNGNLAIAVDEGLKLLRQLPSDGEMQAILLMPVFLLGCAAFEPSQRPEIAKAFDGLQSYRNSGNIRHARTVVEGVWQMMDRGDDNSWDWETLMDRMGLDFLIT
ncbi:MAG: hypothetical protein M1828_003226 [Chrysothrix sp. TS-e1954]|nr:MAG: hypothetical protein M1828_003226 [Chrysothrix sp. TS-e1954]